MVSTILRFASACATFMDILTVSINLCTGKTETLGFVHHFVFVFQLKNTNGENTWKIRSEMDVAPLYKLLTLVASLYEFCIHKLFVMLHALVISPSLQSGYQVVSCIADISHHCHYQQWCTFSSKCTFWRGQHEI